MQDLSFVVGDCGKLIRIIFSLDFEIYLEHFGLVYIYWMNKIKL